MSESERLEGLASTQVNWEHLKTNIAAKMYDTLYTNLKKKHNRTYEHALAPIASPLIFLHQR